MGAGGTLLQLNANGKENIWLTKEPQINMFKYVYYRYINFTTDIVQLNLSDLATFGKKTTCIIKKKWHLLSKLYLQLTLPAIELVNGSYLSWCDTLGYAIFDQPVELLIDGVIIDRLYPVFMDCYDELSLAAEKRKGRNLMLLKSDIYRSNLYNAKNKNTVMIPLEFWFTKEYSMALPLLSIYTDDIQLNFSFKEFNKCINYDGTIIPENIQILDSNVYAEYIWLDNDFINYFQKEKHSYIINQTEYHGNEIINSNINNYTTHLKFSNPSKELILTFVDSTNITNNNYFNYNNNNNQSFISNISMYLDGVLRFDNLPEFYYRCMFPDSCHSNIPDKYIYTIPFSSKPENNQPSGVLSFSQFTDISLNFSLIQNNTDIHLYLYSIMYNLLVIDKGRISFEYAI